MAAVPDVRALVVGCGSIGSRHARNLRELGVADVRVHDADPGRAEALAAEVGAKVEPELDAALTADGQGVALVCTPPALHLEQALAAASAGWDLFVEKPLATSTAGLDELVRIAEARALATLVGFNFRFEPGLLRVRELLETRALGRPLAVRGIAGQYLPDWHPWEDYREGYSARRELGGGVLLDYSHELDTLVWLFGDPAEVSCRAVRTGALELDVEDLAHLELAFEGGVQAQLQLDYLQRAPRRELEIACTEGTIRWRYDERRLDVFRAGERWASESLRDDHNETYVDELRHLLDAVRTRVPTRCDLREGLRSLRLIERARGEVEV